MDRRFALFLALSLAVVLGHAVLTSKLNPPPPQQPKPAEVVKAEEAAKAKPDEKQPAKAEATKPQPGKEPGKEPGKGPAKASEIKPAAKPAPGLEVDKDLTEKWVAIGSIDEKSPYRMGVTITSRGAAVVRAELNGPKYHDIEDRSGYLGHVAMSDVLSTDGCRVDVVVAGTPAAKAGLRAGDVIRAVDGTAVKSAKAFQAALAKRKPKHPIALEVFRDGRTIDVGPVTLARRPLEVMRPEADDPLSFLLTLNSVDDEKLGEAEKALVDNRRELQDVTLRTGVWKITDQQEDSVTLRSAVPRLGLEVFKQYRLAKAPEASAADPDYKAYHLTLDVTLRNLDSRDHKVSYQFDGPTGLPTEGYWYVSKVQGSLRDFVVSPNGKGPKWTSSDTVADDKASMDWDGGACPFVGVDAQFFASLVLPQGETPENALFAKVQPLRVGKVDPNWKKKVDVSCRLVSKPVAIKAGGGELKQQFVLFAGPKRPDLVDQYKLTGLIDYGWFTVIAIPMLKAMHAFYRVIPNYGIAIVMLTVLVRLCMFPLSRRQAIGAQKMQTIQPEMKRLQEKHKGDVQGMRKAQQELFRKHEYNPLSGCLTIFIQLPIFVALYRSLMVDVELRQAPLISEAVRWCSNLAGPDMLFDWQSFMPAFVTEGASMFSPGPYFNILPIITILLFLWQQQKMMPPPADEQAAMQQKMMKFMMIFMGILFYKVASGLCVYFIASTLWGLAERKFLPKSSSPNAASAATRTPTRSRR